MEYSIENMCRTCMNEENEMISIFLSENKEKSFAEMLTICAAVKVT